MKCSIEDCSKPAFSRGWCRAHYQRWYKYGDPTTLRQNQIHGAALMDRFNAYVGERGRGCWEWQGYRDGNGYGRINIDGVPQLAHRVGWQLLRGELTAEQHVLHRCDNPPCVRPEHLFLGDQVANNADKMKKKRHRYGVSRGSAHGCSKLTEAQVLEIRKSIGPSKDVAARYGVSGRTVREIRTRKSWRHLP